MNASNARLGMLVGAALALPTYAASAQPAWQDPDFVMPEIVVTRPRAAKPAIDVVGELVVTLSRHEQQANAAAAIIETIIESLTFDDVTSVIAIPIEVSFEPDPLPIETRIRL